ncbi:MAG: hypothetical protein JO153_22155 [Solirubrobacterales bacterium]|nr:hypothetical protein [Solirubrobacterales bacterium]
MDALRTACAAVAERARHVQIDRERISAYAAELPLPLPAAPPAGARPRPHATDAGVEPAATFWITLDAINFGSGWFPTLRKRPGRSGYHTVAAGLTAQFDAEGPWSAARMREIDSVTIARVLGQDPEHPLMELFARSLRDLGANVLTHHASRFDALVDAASGSAVTLATGLGAWDCFADSSTYDELTLPFLKRAQIVAADLARAGVAGFHDLPRLTLFADNLVPHVLRLDGVLRFDQSLVARIEREELIEHGSREEVEIRACALHAVELIVAARPGSHPAAIDQLLWERGQQPRYKASPRHRSRCTAY